MKPNRAEDPLALIERDVRERLKRGEVVPAALVSSVLERAVLERQALFALVECLKRDLAEAEAKGWAERWDIIRAQAQEIERLRRGAP